MRARILGDSLPGPSWAGQPATAISAAPLAAICHADKLPFHAVKDGAATDVRYKTCVLCPRLHRPDPWRGARVPSA